MALTIQTNTLSIAARRHLNETSERLQDSLNKLASGSRINKSADDAAGLAISESINAETRSLGQAVRNAQDGISLVQVFEGGTSVINNMVMRIRELSIHAASDTIGDRERTLIDNEVQQSKQEIDRVAKSVSFLGLNLLDGSNNDLEIQVGTNNNEDVDRIKFESGDNDLTLDGLGIDDISVLDKDDAREGLAQLDEVLFKVNTLRARVGSTQSRLESTVLSQGIFQENLLAAKSRLKDTDMAEESSNRVRETILQQAGISVLTQANQAPQMALRLIDQ